MKQEKRCFPTGLDIVTRKKISTKAAHLFSPKHEGLLITLLDDMIRTYKVGATQEDQRPIISIQEIGSKRFEEAFRVG